MKEIDLNSLQLIDSNKNTTAEKIPSHKIISINVTLQAFRYPNMAKNLPPLF